MACQQKQGNQVFSPMDFPGIRIWLDASWGISIGVGNNVVAWADRSNSGTGPFLQLSVPNQPVRSPGALNGRDVIVFTAANSNFMNGGLFVSDFFDVTKNHGSVALVLQTNSGVADNCIFGPDSNNVFTSWVAAFIAYIDGLVYWDAGNATNGPAGARLFPAPANDAATFCIYVFVRNGSTSLIYKNNTLLTSNTVGSVYVSGAPGVYLGSSNTGGVAGQFADMQLAEWCVWQSALSASQVSILSREWGVKYGITVA